ncbi:MAG TPA: C4-dicarboxylate ABC transporter permease [Gammaproteobacteria bacterium]|nr:C4-dicarboxylate ABC transporter permease [Gammaproteobacteria bacterium]HCG71298.1 C4-dicarboxylate ABC transporter permease [Gammaproteobacteria bacterium]
MAMLHLLAGLSRVTSVLVRPLRWLALVMVLLTFAIVLLRYALNSGGALLPETVMYLHGTFFMLAIALGISENTHVRVDILYSRRIPAQQQWIDLAGHVLFLLPVAVFMIWVSLPYVSSSWQILEGSSEVGGIPGVFLLKTLMPLTGLLLLTQGIAGIASILLGKLRP